ncbi:class I SAM-dependent methyltransferase [Candidatus Gottesmanbacteria bacterium]|nr:class I SAM-dependent methyltransferase [Candidatus Gottesmanbacteria bacterium]
MINNADLLEAVYSKLKDPYEQEYFKFHSHRYRYVLTRILSLNLPPKARILDIGCYPLHMFTALKLRGFSLFGISSFHEPIKLPNISVINIEKSQLPYKNNFFDLILFSEVMEHLTTNPLVYLREIRRVLSPQGILILTTPNAAGLHKLVPILLGRSTYFPLADMLATNLNDESIYKRHNREYTRDELILLLSQTGFGICHSAYFNAYRSYAFKDAQGNFTRQLARIGTYWLTQGVTHRRDTLYIEAEKNPRYKLPFIHPESNHANKKTGKDINTDNGKDR